MTGATGMMAQQFIMLSIEKCKKILQQTGKVFTDEEVKQIRQMLYKLLLWTVKKMLGLIFPTKLVFKNSPYRTTQPNEILTLLCNNNKDFKENKKGQEVNNNNLSFMVASPGIEPESKV